MSITCQLCGETFEKIIPWQHLKTSHGISGPEYRLKHGPTVSTDTLSKLKARVPHNKGKKVTDLAVLDRLKEGIKRREERYANGELVRKRHPWSDEHKQNLSVKAKDYAWHNKEKMMERAQKAINTKLSKYGSMPTPFKGKTHSDQAKEKIRAAALRANQKKSEAMWSRIAELSDQYNLKITSPLGQDPIDLTCKTCQTPFQFTAQYFTPSKTHEKLCPKCYPRAHKVSKGENELYEFVASLCPDAVSSHRDSYHSKEIDVFVPSKNIGFEYDGLYWHSQEFLESIGQPKTKSLKKRSEFLSQGRRVVFIFEDEWHNKRPVVEDRIATILGAGHQVVIPARKCVIKEISSKKASNFCNANHIMGAGRSNVRYGLFFNDELVSVMTFSSSNLSRKISSWELNRFVSKLGTRVQGGASKLFSMFVRSIKPTTIVSYSDNRWSDGNLYAQLGFSKVSDGTPNYWYVRRGGTSRVHRFTLRKKPSDNQALSEYENRLQEGWSRVWDCGSSKWVWTAKS